MGYDLVQIANTTPYPATGWVEYASALCNDDRYTVREKSSWTADDRGYCLVTRISAGVATGGGKIVEATAYTSSGTSYSRFAIIQSAPGKFEVIRRVSGAHDTPPPDHIEPTEPQK